MFITIMAVACKSCIGYDPRRVQIYLYAIYGGMGMEALLAVPIFVLYGLNFQEPHHYCISESMVPFLYLFVGTTISMTAMNFNAYVA